MNRVWLGMSLRTPSRQRYSDDSTLTPIQTFSGQGNMFLIFKALLGLLVSS